MKDLTRHSRFFFAGASDQIERAEKLAPHFEVCHPRVEVRDMLFPNKVTNTDTCEHKRTYVCCMNVFLFGRCVLH